LLLRGTGWAAPAAQHGKHQLQEISMNKDQVKGKTNQATGEIKEQVGKLTGDTSTRVGGHAREMKGKLQEAKGDAKEAVKHDDRALGEQRKEDLDR
jgi:uncharacterized protein YjbJ (UPF0337 family)